MVIIIIIKQLRETQTLEFYSDDIIKIKFVILWNLLGCIERTTPERPTCQKLALCGKLPRRY